MEALVSQGKRKAGDVDPRILQLSERVVAKRPRTVIEHILNHGFVTTEELQTLYGYDHPPRAVRDVRENGVPIETFKVASQRTGRMIAAYRFGDPSEVRSDRLGGRRSLSKRFRDALLARYGSRSTITGERLDPRYLQIDHRVPYEVAGDADGADLESYMLLDASSQRAKSWSCEHCRNWRVDRDPAVCRSCFWAFPERYSHVALEPQRRADVVWSGSEVAAYDRLVALAQSRGETVASLIKQLVAEAR